ncbi:hypothetical protein CAEBREN_02655 [Caenorhabditis brenneri]|uniref:Uncharacterized protein n=1 Tax=Caenorhabditis brenneri TaxID=135651 RepID=G0MEQ6_CAEBE|nr:hypothetical protein CAEBREN_02655 [Caenorhabditis brenneri]
MRIRFVRLLSLVSTWSLLLFLYSNEHLKSVLWRKTKQVAPVAEIKEGNKWIVVTSISLPTEDVKKHTNGNSSQVLCYKMKRAAVQQGLVHHDPDVDAIYRLLHADSSSGLDVKFNKFAPPITLSIGTYSPWNSQNTLFHKSAFHTLYLPTTVSFRTTDIWRSFISQKILHLSGLTVSFVPTNAVQFRNAHDYLKDFKDEKQVYEDSGKMIEFLHKWKCSNESSNSLEKCINQLSDDMVINGLFKLPELIKEVHEDPYLPSSNETDRNVNCRRMNLEFALVDPKEEEEQGLRKAIQKLNYFGDIIEWCNETDLTESFRSPEQLKKKHDESYVLQKDLNSVLIVVNNFAWKYGIGLIQRLYQPYFASVIFCGSFYPEKLEEQDNYTSTINPINYVHMNPAEIVNGAFAYHCVTLVKEIGMSNVEGYFLMADDTVFNIWQRIDYSRVHHLSGVRFETEAYWWNSKMGFPAAQRVVETVRNSRDEKLLKAWKKYENGLKKYGYINETETAESGLLAKKGKSISDFYYIPTSESDYYATLMRLFYESRFFLELAVNTFLKSVNHQTSLLEKKSYLWGEKRPKWASFYNKDLVGMHPVKMSQFRIPGIQRTDYCRTIIQTWSDIMFGGSQNFTIKNDTDADYRNG